MIENFATLQAQNMTAGFQQPAMPNQSHHPTAASAETLASVGVFNRSATRSVTREMKRLLLLLCLSSAATSGADTEPAGYSPDLYPVVQRAVAEVCRGMWGRESQPPKHFVLEVLSMFHFQRIDLNSDGQEEVIATTAELPHAPNGDIFIFARGKGGWKIIGDFDGYGGYIVTDEFIGRYRTIRTRHADDAATYASFHVATYIFRGQRYEASTPKERVRDASRN